MKKILLIEDNDDLRENTAEILALSGYEVLTAADGKQGVEMALAGRPDLVLCDIMMPGVDGYAVLHMLHSNEALKKLPFIFLSAKSERSDFRRGMELGADDYLTKPFSTTELLTAIETRLALSDQDVVDTPASADEAALRVSFLAFLHGEMAVQDRAAEVYRKNQVVYNEGNRPQSLFFVQKGKVKASRENDQGKELVVELYGEGEFFGYIALMEGGQYKEKAVSLEESELVVIPKAEFEALLRHSDVATSLLAQLARTVSIKEQQLLSIAYSSLREKVAAALLLLHQKTARPGVEATSLSFSREVMAAIAGTATESLTRTLSDFKSEHLIDIHVSTVRILDIEKLESVARGGVMPSQHFLKDRSR
ncbi:MAG: transcriptional regulator [Flaviaesturariibacter sp.]|nr:transcriptional regulator [Flaviaesturariibacter sp.]